MANEAERIISNCPTESAISSFKSPMWVVGTFQTLVEWANARFARPKNPPLRIPVHS